VLELAVPTARFHPIPAVCLEQFQNFAHLHGRQHTARDAQGEAGRVATLAAGLLSSVSGVSGDRAMDAKWFDRERIENEVTGIEFAALTYDPGFGHTCYNGEPFTGVSILRYPDGSLRSIVQYVNGLGQGVAVIWHPNGQLRTYREVESDVLHGVEIQWAPDGQKSSEERYIHGRRANRQTPDEAGETV
jgi:hypothetical protein